MSEISETKPSRKVILPRWVAVVLGFFAWFVAIPLVHCGLPWAISLLAPRYGWTEGKPGVWNLFGLIAVASAIICLIWIMVLGIAHTPEKVDLYSWHVDPPFLRWRPTFERVQ